MYTYAHTFPACSPAAQAFLIAFLPLLIVVAVWTLIIKGYALWHAARNSQKGWFIALLIVNTVGILEIVYLIWFRPSSHTPPPAVNSSSQA